MRSRRGATGGHWWGRLLVVTPLLGAAGCVLGSGDSDTCLFEGHRYRSGESFSIGVDCNTCSCGSRGVSCTHRTCELPDAGSPDTAPPDTARPDTGPPDTAPPDTAPPDTGRPETSPADALVTCQAGSRRYGQGAFFPSPDGCNFCSCIQQDVITCTTRFCPDGGGSELGCNFETSYRYSYQYRLDGGSFSVLVSSTLSPFHNHMVTKTPLTSADAGAQECAAELACVDAARVDVVEIRQALADPDVVTALTLPWLPAYGVSPDQPVFYFRRADGRGFDLGPGPAPAGVRALADLLLQAESQTSATCPGF